MMLLKIFLLMGCFYAAAARIVNPDTTARILLDGVWYPRLVNEEGTLVDRNETVIGNGIMIINVEGVDYAPFVEKNRHLLSQDDIERIMGKWRNI